MSKWTKVYTLEGVTDFYADDDFEDALREVFGEEPDLSVKVRITVENDDEAAAELSALRERVEALERIRDAAKVVSDNLSKIEIIDIDDKEYNVWGIVGDAEKDELAAALQAP